LIVDDVISAGTSIGESVAVIKNAAATPAGVVIALDRQERGHASASAVQEVETRFGVRVFSIAKLETLIAYLSEIAGPHLAAIQSYRTTYGI
jgi:orotate phosphoribosyltransferase